MFGLGPQEIILLVVAGVLLFGRKLPDIGRSVGKSIVEFKKGIGGMEDELNTTNSNSRTIEPEPVRAPQRASAQGAPRFDSTPATSEMPPTV